MEVVYLVHPREQPHVQARESRPSRALGPCQAACRGRTWRICCRSPGGRWSAVHVLDEASDLLAVLCGVGAADHQSRDVTCPRAATQAERSSYYCDLPLASIFRERSAPRQQGPSSVLKQQVLSTADCVDSECTRGSYQRTRGPLPWVCQRPPRCSPTRCAESTEVEGDARPSQTASPACSRGGCLRTLHRCSRIAMGEHEKSKGPTCL